MGSSWFSGALHLLVVVGGEPVRREESVVLFQAADWDYAVRRALEIGRSHERSHVNGDGDLVEWRLAEIRTLDEIGEVTDGREVFSRSLDLMPGDEAGADLRPEDSPPTHSGV